MYQNGYELYHYGVPKMRWGVRRWQNEDGSLTEAGRKHYNDLEETSSSLKKEKEYYDTVKATKRAKAASERTAEQEDDYEYQQALRSAKISAIKQGKDVSISSSAYKGLAKAAEALSEKAVRNVVAPWAMRKLADKIEKEDAVLSILLTDLAVTLKATNDNYNNKSDKKDKKYNKSENNEKTKETSKYGKSDTETNTKDNNEESKQPETRSEQIKKYVDVITKRADKLLNKEKYKKVGVEESGSPEQNAMNSFIDRELEKRKKTVKHGEYYMMYREPYPNELMHFGIIGQKWGIRRYQNYDGTYTPAGREHYGRASNKIKERLKTDGKSERKQKIDFDRAAVSLYNMGPQGRNFVKNEMKGNKQWNKLVDRSKEIGDKTGKQTKKLGLLLGGIRTADNIFTLLGPAAASTKLATLVTMPLAGTYYWGSKVLDDMRKYSDVEVKKLKNNK